MLTDEFKFITEIDPAPPTDALEEVTEWDRKLAGEILEDLATCEEGISSQQKLAEWIRNIRRTGRARC